MMPDVGTPASRRRSSQRGCSAAEVPQAMWWTMPALWRLRPEVERRRGADAPDDGVDHPGAGPAGLGVRVLEEGHLRARAPALVRIEEVVDVRVVLVDRLGHQAQPEDPGVEVDVARGVAG